MKARAAPDVEDMRAILPLLLVLALPAALGGAADDDPDDDKTVAVEVRVSPLGNVNLTFYSYSGGFLDVIPGALNCSWLESGRTEYTVHGTCRGWLKPSEGDNGTLRLAGLVAALEQRGAHSVEVRLTSSGSNGTASQTYSPSTGVPGDVVIPLQARPDLLVPILLVLSVPLLLAYAVRRNLKGASADRKMNWIVWMHWTQLGVWLYWISSVNPVELSDYLLLVRPFGNLVLLALGVALYVAPPLVSMCACLTAMAPLLSSSKESLKVLVRQQLTAQASVQIPLGIFLVGMGSTSHFAAPTLSLVLAYVVYRGLAWLNWSMSYSEVTPLEAGELFDQATALARKAGVKISRLGLLRTRVPEQANAFAMSGDRIVLTESLVRGLTTREVNAVIAHELGHHKAGHVRWDSSKILFWVFVFGLGPALGWMVARYHLPTWFLTIPIGPLAVILLQGLLSQRRELDADARAADITGDPEGKIAALGRLAQLSRMPVEGRGIMQSIMSHPSMENRVLAIARRNNIPDLRALAILRNPDEAYSDSIGNLAFALNQNRGSQPGVRDPVFNLRARAGYLEQIRWLHLLGPVMGAFLLGLAMDKLLAPMSVSYFRYYRWIMLAVLLLAPPLLLGFEQAAHVLLGRGFIQRLRRRIAVRLAPGPYAAFTGIHPGSGVRYTEGFPDWDFGFITLENDWLVYRGEKARFAIARQDILGTSIVRGPVRWLREHRVEVLFRGGVFTLNLDFANPTQKTAQRTEYWISAWRAVGFPSRSYAAAPEPPPKLPQLPGMTTGRVGPLWFLAKTVLKIWLAAPLLYFTGMGLHVVGSVLVMFGAPVAVFLQVLPSILWPVQRIEEPAGDDQRLGMPELVTR